MSMRRDDSHLSNDSFRREFRYRPARYQTPPPPLDFIEPISAPAGQSLEQLWNFSTSPRKRSYHEAGLHGTAVNGGGSWGQEQERHPDGSVRQRQPSHHSESIVKQQQQCPTPLDVFATVATSPSLGAGSPHAFANGSNGATTPISPLQNGTLHWQDGSGRPTKRSRSEVIDQRRFPPTTSRPSTSHVPHSHQFSRTNGYHHHHEPLQVPSDTTMRDAELLLLFARGRDEVPARPVFAPDGLGISHMSAHHPSRSLGNMGDIRATYNGERSQAAVAGVHMWNQTHDGWQDGSNPGDRLGGVDETVQLPQKPKGRGGKGWPKGKPRGPRQYNPDKASAKPPKQKPGRKQTSRKSRRDGGVVSGAANSLTTAAPAHGGASTDESQQDTVFTARPRRKSIMDFHTTLHSSDLPKSPHRPTSAPPSSAALGDPRMNYLTGYIMDRRSLKKRKQLAQTTLCASCNNYRDSPNGYVDFWISCNGCKAWFHHTCVGFKSEREVRDVDKFHCKTCQPTHGPTTFVRKSSRAHASVDYAGLNEGTYRTSTDVPDHHYIKPIKEGKIQFQPETFARMPPELVTAEYFEKCTPLAEPIVIPAWMNPRPPPPGDLSEDDAILSTNHEDQQDEEFHFSDYEYDCVPDQGQDKLDMVIPYGLSVRTVTDLYGPDEKVEVIDVKSQEGEDKRWNMRQWADYYEAHGEKPVRNVISLEVSQSKLGRLIQRPKVVRDLDLQDAVWPREEIAKGICPRVQFYCLMSVADCYTDFHIDFGGSSVYYHILKGKKTFFFIPPKKQHLKKYEEWCLSANQGSVFLGDETKECYRVDLSEGDTMLIPSGWIHAVWTPENSLVIGGNFLTRMHYGMQIQINDIEKNTGVARKFRYPFFQKVLWCAVLDYLRHDPIPSTVVQSFYESKVFERKTPIYYDFDQDDEEDQDVEVAPENFNARYYSQGEIEGLPDLLRYVLRTVLVSLGKIPGVTKATQEAVGRSMPKGYGDHLDLVRTFAMWIAWKQGNEEIPAWAYPNADLSEVEAAMTEKKPVIVSKKRTDKYPVIEGERRSSRQMVKDQARESAFDGEQQIAESKPGDVSVTESPLAQASDFGERFGISVIQTGQPGQVEVDGDMTDAINPAANSLDQGMQATPNSGRPKLVAVVINNDDRSLFEETKPPISPLTPPAQMESDGTATNKRSRAKACLDCRRSKRRCIHDENGQIDPIKAQEPATHRAPSGPKRSREEDDGESSVKRLKAERFPSGAWQTQTPPYHDDPSGTRVTATVNVPRDETPSEAASGEAMGAREDAMDVDGPLPVSVATEPTAIRPQSVLDGQDVAPVQPSETRPVKGEDVGLDTVGLEDAAVRGAAERPISQRTPSHASHDGSDVRLKSHVDSSETRSRTPSLHVKTNSTKSIGTPTSPPSSPLTDLELSSPKRDQLQPVASNKSEETPRATRTTPRQRKQVERFTDSSETAKSATEPRKAPSRKPTASLTPAPPAAPKFSSGAKDRRRSSQSRSTAASIAGSAAGSPLLASRVKAATYEPEEPEDEDERLARQLMEQEFGLRRRRS